jgi:hypothetical protein
MLSRPFRANYILVEREHPKLAILFGTDPDDERRILRLSVAYNYYVGMAARKQADTHQNRVVYYKGFYLEFGGFHEEISNDIFFVNYTHKTKKPQTTLSELASDNPNTEPTFKIEEITFDNSLQCGTPSFLFLCRSGNFYCNCDSCVINAIVSHIRGETGAQLVSFREMLPDEVCKANPRLDPIVHRACMSKGMFTIRLTNRTKPKQDDGILDAAVVAAARA